MARFNPWDSQFSRPALREKRLEFKAPEWALTLRELDHVQLCRAQDRVDEHEDLYVRGKDGQPPLQLVTPDGQIVPVSRALLGNLLAAEAMQVPAEGEEPYTWMDFLGIALKFPRQWKRITAAVAELWRAADEGTDPGNAPEGGTTT